jgi:hypothetical protein
MTNDARSLVSDYPSPTRKRAGICANEYHSHKYPRACAWGSDGPAGGLSDTVGVL